MYTYRWRNDDGGREVPLAVINAEILTVVGDDDWVTADFLAQDVLIPLLIRQHVCCAAGMRWDYAMYLRNRGESADRVELFARALAKIMPGRTFSASYSR